MANIKDVAIENLVTVKTKFKKSLTLQIDTGASCNVIPEHTYEDLTEDYEHTEIQTSKVKEITVYGEGKWPVMGERIFKVFRKKESCLIRGLIVSGRQFHAILGKRACEVLKIVKIMDNDAINTVANIQKQVPLTKQTLIDEYNDVFTNEVGRLEEEYQIKVKQDVKPVKHAQRSIAIPLQKEVKAQLDELVMKKMIIEVTTPTPWTSSLVVTKKKSGKIRLCLDPNNLNECIERENYPLPTIEDLAAKLNKARVFTVLDVKNGFWHVPLEEKSTYLTTFNTPYGRYRWLRMPFGLCSAPEIFQRRMNELIEGMAGIQVIADDFLIYGCGSTNDIAVKDHDRVLRLFLDKCRKANLHLNSSKIKLREREVPYIGHILSEEGITVNPDKVKAIKELKTPTDVTEIKRFLGMIQYIDKFINKLSDRTIHMRRLTRKDVTWNWTTKEDNEYKELKKSITTTPILRYYDVNAAITIQCDSSKYGLGAVLMQEKQPVAYASKSLTPTEIRYAQIEKEMLAIVFSCQKFRQYIYGKQNIVIHTDHKPLIRIMQKPLNDISTRLQKMRLRLQQYDLELVYVPGKDLNIADTLSRDLLVKKENNDILPEVVSTVTLAVTTIDWKTSRRTHKKIIFVKS